VLPVSSHTDAQPYMLLVVCLVDVMLLQARPCSNHAPLQISDVEYGPAVDTHLVMPQTLSSTGFRSGVYLAATDLRQCSAVSHIFDAVLHASKVIASFYKVQYKHIKLR